MKKEFDYWVCESCGYSVPIGKEEEKGEEDVEGEDKS